MNRPATVAPSPVVRRLVLGTAFFLGLAVALAPRSPPAHAQEPTAPPVAAPQSVPKSVSITDGRGGQLKIEVGESPLPATKSEATGASSNAATPSERATENPASRGAKTRKQARVTIDGVDSDREFDSFDEFVDNEPALFLMVATVVAIVFLAPVLAIALIVWYRMRKARMLNETMLKLAEKGIVPSADALEALTGGKQPAAVAPYYEQAKQVRRRAAWSDLRKGVLMAGFGFALSMYSFLGSRGPNAIGLVLLFVGLGFVVLWWFEERHLAHPPSVSHDAAPGPAPGPSPGNPPPI